MNIIQGYTITEQLHKSENSSVYRALKGESQEPVILKILSGEYPSPGRLAKFRREYDIIRGFDFEGIVKANQLSEHNHSLLLELEDSGGESLNKILKKRKLDLKEALTLTHRLAEILEYIHNQNVIHKDINPANIIWNENSNKIKIIDFGISTNLVREIPEPGNTNVLEGTLAYISPEQTGRMNRSLDYRSDYYSLGATFYEILLGKPPFYSKDPLELLHFHLAKNAAPPIEIDKEIPRTVSDIVMKLLAKKAEDRYQSAHGLAFDLKTCLEQVKSRGEISEFRPGRKDRSGRFQVSQKLHGRDVELRVLLSSFERTALGAVEFVLVGGFAGIGKSAFVHEIYRPITEKRGYFTRGKFEQLKRDIPYDSLLQALRHLFRQILTEGDSDIATWRAHLQSHLGINGGVLIPFLPELGWIIGEQPTILKLSSEHDANRFKLTCLKLIQALASREHPLVLFLDDLHRADPPTLKLLELILTDPELEYLLLIGAYRNNETEENHPLLNMLAKLSNSRATLNQINLAPLSEESVRRLTEETLDNVEQRRTNELARLLLNKTNGNPFFLNQFLIDLYRKKLIQFDHEQDRWDWDVAKIQDADVTDNVVELMSENIAKLTPRTQEALKYAACVGGEFDLNTLSIILEQTKIETADRLREALQAGLLLPANDGYKFIGYGEDSPAHYRFLHDRVQQAAYALIEEQQKPALHLKVGRLMRDNTPLKNRDDKIFEIAGHLNAGKELLNTQAELYALAELNLQAGQKAKNSAAHEPAFNYLETGLNLLPANSWDTNYDLTLALHTKLTDAAVLCGNYEMVKKLSDRALGKTRNLNDRANIYELYIQSLFAQNRLREAVDTGFMVLPMLGVKIPRRPGKRHLLTTYIKLKWALLGKSINDLLNLPETKEPEVLSSLRIATSIGLPAYYSAPELLPLITFTLAHLNVKKGNSVYSSYIISSYAMILGYLGNIEGAYKFGRLSMALLKKRGEGELKALTILSYYGLIHPWKKEIQDALPFLKEAYQIALDRGDQEPAALSMMIYFNLSFSAGVNLDRLNKDFEIYSGPLIRLGQKSILYNIKQWRQTLHNFQGRADNPHTLKGELYNQETMYSIHQEAGDKSALVTVHLCNMILAYFFGKAEDGLEDVRQGKINLEGIIGTHLVSVFYLYEALLNLRAAGETEGIFTRSQKRKFRQASKIGLKKMKKWAKHAPVNFLHKYWLLLAESNRVAGRDFRALDAYRKATEYARKNKFIHEEALAYELCGKFHLSRGDHFNAGTHLREAYYLYQSWGAQEKTKRLKEDYPGIFSLRVNNRPQLNETDNETTLLTTTSGSSRATSSRLDIATALKASRAIGSEIVLADLLRNMMRIVIENAGASRGILLLKNKDRWFIEAQGDLNHSEVSVLRSIPVDSGNVPRSLINLVTHTREGIILADASGDEKYSADEYIQNKQPGSVLCAPVEHHGNLIGIIYLENNLSSGVFTTDRLELIRVLAAQTAVSLENARVYADLEDKVRERTGELDRALKSLEEKDRIIQIELDLARSIQQGIIPDLPGRIGPLSIHGHYRPLGKVGGDVYDFFPMGQGQAGVMIGDASGHGIHAAFITALAKVSFTAGRGLASPGAMLKQVNRDLLSAVRTSDYLTACLLAIDNQGAVIHAGAAHPEPLVLRLKSRRVDKWTAKSWMLGLLKEPVENTQNFRDYHYSLASGDRILLYTDGLTEASNTKNEIFGDERLCQILLATADLPPAEVTREILRQFDSFTRDEKLQDDVTFLLLSYVP